MSFDKLLNEYRRRAGLPFIAEQLPASHAEKTEGEERQYIDKISNMFRRIHAAAEQGWKDTNHPGFAEILKAMGVMQESIDVPDPDINLGDLTEFESEEEEVANIRARAGVK